MLGLLVGCGPESFAPENEEVNSWVAACPINRCPLTVIVSTCVAGDVASEQANMMAIAKRVSMEGPCDGLDFRAMANAS